MGDRSEGPRIVGGALRLEARLLDDITLQVGEAQRSPHLLKTPVRVVVPSDSLRVHLIGRLLARYQRAVAGVVVQTLYTLAAEVLRRSGEPPPRGSVLLRTLVRRLSGREKALTGPAELGEKGLGAVVASVRDLLDAGASVDSAPALLAALDRSDATVGGEERRRAESLVRVACSVAGELDRLGAGGPGALLRRAGALLEQDPELLPARRILVHGFADATGAVTQVLAVLTRRPGATIYLDLPPDPGDPSSPDLGVEFARRLASRLGIGGETAAGAAPQPPTVTLLRAGSPESEIRAVANRVRRLLDTGTIPERIGIVARDLSAYTAVLARQLGRVGVPFSGAELTSRGPAARRAGALAGLLRRGEETPVDIWLAALGWDDRELLAGLWAAGAFRLADARSLAVDEVLGGRDALRLPLIGARGGGSEAPGTRWLPASRLVRAVSAAAWVCEHFASWPVEASPTVHRACTEELLGEAARLEGSDVADALVDLADDMGSGILLQREEWFAAAAQALDGVGARRLGGEGGGVAISSVIAARARTFDHLFLIGMSRGGFPRPVSEDPVLPDHVRVALAGVLPDIPIKCAGHVEERYLFAQLFWSAPAVTLAWSEADDEGAPRSASPFVERVRLGAAAAQVVAVDDADRVGDGDPWPALRHATAVALTGSRRQFRDALALALTADPADERALAAADALAAVKVAILDELDPDRRTPAGRERSQALGPFLGGAGGVRGREVSVTTLERYAACPWQVFLERTLRVLPLPDPLADAPDLDPRHLGTLVHAVLERVVRESAGTLPGGFSEASNAAPVRVGWPEKAVLDRIVAIQSRRVLHEAGLPVAGLERVLAAAAQRYLEVARRVVWAAGGLDATGVEVEGEIDLPESWRVRFRADLVERVDGRLIITDYKTGGTRYGARKAETRERHLLADLRKGVALQAAAYAVAGGAGARGRYLFLGPQADSDDERAVGLNASAEIQSLFCEVVGTLLAGWEHGVAIPRLVDPATMATPRTCDTCQVAEACLQHDSGARRRLAAWGARSRTGSASPWEDAALRVWRLPTTAAADPGGEG